MPRSPYDASMPAFPRTPSGGGGEQYGMDLRDYFAGQVLANATLVLNGEQGWNENTVAKTAYIIADAMMKARVKC